MNLNDSKPLQPLTHGNILIVGTKPSNFDDEIRTHPRVILWDSQQQHWTSKNLPDNVRAIFITRFIGHAEFGNILREARKRKITIFNPEGTGIIARQVKELLDIPYKVVVYDSPEKLPVTTQQTKTGVSKLHVLIPFIDFEKTNKSNAELLYVRLPQFGITSTIDSLANFVGIQRKKAGKYLRVPASVKHVAKIKSTSKVDVSVEILDNMVKELQDMRDFLIAIVEENKTLKARIETLKKALND